MKVLVDGPSWTGMWSEISAETFGRLGHEAEIFHNNRKTLKMRMLKRANDWVPGTRERFSWEACKIREMVGRLEQGDFDLLFSIQGRLDSRMCADWKSRFPKLKIAYWLGDILTPNQEARIGGLLEASRRGWLDLFLCSYQGTVEWLERRGVTRVMYCPFGYSPGFHTEPTDSAKEEDDGYDVSFVGTAYDNRARLIQALNEVLDRPVAVFGRSWRKFGMKSFGGLTLPESLRVHRKSKISLNLHHEGTDRGFNMKFYEIPAVGGFQICDFQTTLAVTPLAETPSFGDQDELIEKIRYFLRNDRQRDELRLQLQRRVKEECDYAVVFGKILERLGAVSV